MLYIKIYFVRKHSLLTIHPALLCTVFNNFTNVKMQLIKKTQNKQHK